MTLKEQIENATNQALTERDELGLSVFRLIKSAIKNTEIEKGHELNDDEVIAVLEKQAKQRKDSIEQFEKANRGDLADKERAELKLIEKYLPEKMSDEEIRTVVRAKLTELEGQDFGRVMGTVMAELKGKADGGTVQRIVREEMGQS